MAETTNDLKHLEERVAQLDAQRMAWRWSSDNSLAPLEAEIQNVLEQMTYVYSSVTEAQRIYVREMMRSHPTIAIYLQAVASGDIRTFDSDISLERLRLALIAVSMANNNFGDHRDLIVLLGSLWRRAAQAGIDPAPFFQSVAALSDPEQCCPGEPSIQDILANFHSYAYVKQDVP